MCGKVTLRREQRIDPLSSHDGDPGLWPARPPQSSSSLRRVLGLVGLGPKPDEKDVEIAVLRHQGSNTAPPSRPIPDLDRGMRGQDSRAGLRLRGHPGPGIEENVRETDEDVPGAWIP